MTNQPTSVPPPTAAAPHSLSTPEQTKTCPRCAETVKDAALACRFCGHEFGQEIGAGSPETNRRTASDKSRPKVPLVPVGAAAAITALVVVLVLVLSSGGSASVGGQLTSAQVRSAFGYVSTVYGLCANYAKQSTTAVTSSQVEADFNKVAAEIPGANLAVRKFDGLLQADPSTRLPVDSFDHSLLQILSLPGDTVSMRELATSTYAFTQSIGGTCSAIGSAIQSTLSVLGS